MESVKHISNIQYVYLLNKYIKCNIWRLAVRYDIHIYVIRRLKVNTSLLPAVHKQIHIFAFWGFTVIHFNA